MWDHALWAYPIIPDATPCDNKRHAITVVVTICEARGGIGAANQMLVGHNQVLKSLSVD